jgi:hypothetical protein
VSANDHEHPPEPGAAWFNYVLAATIAALFGTGIYSAANAPPEAGGGEEHVGLAEAHHWREEAAELAKEGHWAESLEKLSKAKKVDPQGDEEKAIEQLRRLDEEKLRSLPPHEPGSAEEKPGKGPEEAPHEGK